MQEAQVQFLVGKIPWRRKWQPTPVFLPGESMDRGAWQAAVQGVARVRHDLGTKAPSLLAIVPMLHIAFPGLIYFTTGSLYLLVSFTHFIHPDLLPPAATSLFSCIYEFVYLLRCHKEVRIYGICPPCLPNFT